jgi:hypothetical protein
MRLECDFFSINQRSRGLLRSLAKGLAFLRAVGAAEANTLRALVVQDFDGVAVEDGNDTAGEVGERGIGINKENEKCQ